MNKKYLHSLIMTVNMIILSLNLSACSGLLKRSKKAENQEIERTKEAPGVNEANRIKPSPEPKAPAAERDDDEEEAKAKTVPFSEIEGRAKILFMEAEASFREKNFADAQESYLKILRLYPASSFYKRALYMRAVSLYRNKYFADSQRAVREALDTGLLTDRERAELVMIQLNLLMQSKKWDEALLTSREIAPEQAVANKPKARVSTAPFDVQAQALLARVVIYSLLGDETSASHALQEAQDLVSSTRGYGISEQAAADFSSELAWRKLEILAWKCQQKTPPPRMSEDELRTFLDEYYNCGKEIPALLCLTQKKSVSQIASEGARQTFDVFLNFPKTIFKKLPPPARKVSREAQGPYEKELRDFIDVTVRQKSQEYQNEAGCL